MTTKNALKPMPSRNPHHIIIVKHKQNHNTHWKNQSGNHRSDIVFLDDADNSRNEISRAIIAVLNNT